MFIRIAIFFTLGWLIILMKEALYQKSGDPDVSLTGSANLGVRMTLIVIGPLEWEDRLTDYPSPYCLLESLSFPQVTWCEHYVRDKRQNEFEQHKWKSAKITDLRKSSLTLGEWKLCNQTIMNSNSGSNMMLV